MSDLQDGQLIERYVEAGSERAFSELGRRYARLVYSTCLRELHDRSLAEEASQAVFLLLARKGKSLTRQASVAGWLFTASRLVSQNLRKQERRRKFMEERAAGEMTDPPIPPENALWEGLEPHLNTALAHLKPGDREAILLRFFEERSFAETGAALGLSENTARMKVTRALDKLRRQLAKAGVVVSVTVLAALLPQYGARASSSVLAQAIPQIAAGMAASSLAPFSGRAQALARTAQRAQQFSFSRKAAFYLVLGTSGALLGGAKLKTYREPLVLAETRRAAFASLAGTWSGTLEYADDGDGAHHTYPTTLVLSADPAAGTLQYRAAYAGSSRVDAWTGSLDLKSGQFTTSGIQDGRPKRLVYLVEGLEAFVKKTGGFIMTTHDPFAHWDTRQTIVQKGSRLTWSEEVRPNDGQYRFRNRFELVRTF